MIPDITEWFRTYFPTRQHKTLQLSLSGPSICEFGGGGVFFLIFFSPHVP